MNKPRTPRYFPRMKVRGRSRRIQAPIQRLAGAFDGLGVAASRAVFAMESFKSVLYK